MRGRGHDDAEHDRSAVPPPESGPVAQRPTIQIRAGNLRGTILDAIHALGEHDPTLFQAGGDLVTIVREPDDVEPYEHDVRIGARMLVRPGTPKLVSALGMLLERCDAVAQWQRFDARRGEGKAGQREGEWVASNPCTVTVKAIERRKDWPGIRPARGIAEAPFLAPSHNVVFEPGYNKETKLVFLPSCRVYPIKDAPTQDEASAALKFLWVETVGDFPFRDLGEADNEHDPDRELHFLKAREIPDAFIAIAMMLTIFARPAILGAVPGAMFEAAGQGSGKSFQMHAIAMVATGRPASLANYPMRDGATDEPELEKIIAGYAMNGSPIINLDNVKGTLSSATLERALTVPDKIALRVLGANDQRSLPWLATVLLSGNNVTMSSDLAQRLLVARLESRRENPRLRPAKSFRHEDLMGAIKALRPKLIKAVLVILRSYLAAKGAGLNVPDPGTQGSFEAWSKIVPGAIMWAGGPNVIGAFAAGGRGSDDEGEVHGTLMRLWQAGWNSMKAGDILRLLFPLDEREQASNKAPPDGLEDARAAVRVMTRTREGNTPSPHKFGMSLWGYRGKIRDGLKIVGVEDKAAKVKRYSVEEVK